jgi:hypothetical protein
MISLPQLLRKPFLVNPEMPHRAWKTKYQQTSKESLNFTPTEHPAGE